MIDIILMLLKDSVEDAVWRNSDIPSNRKEIATEVSMKIVANSFKTHFASENMENLASLFTGSVNLNGSLVVNSMVSNIARGLSLQAGINSNMEGIAKSIVYDLINNIWTKINSSEESSFTLDNFVYVFSGKTVHPTTKEGVNEVQVNNGKMVLAFDA